MLVNKNYVTPEGLTLGTLGSWIITRRRVFAGSITGDLTSEKIKKLNEIGMVWNAREGSFDRAYEELRLYHDTYGNLDIKAKYVSPSGFNIGNWVSQKRVLVKKHGMDAAESYYKVNGDINIPVNYISDDGLSLGNWLSQLKAGRKNGKKNLSEEQIEEAGFLYRINVFRTMD